MNLNIHFQMLVLDGVYIGGTEASVRFHRVNESSSAEQTQPVHQIAHRVCRYLERQGWLERDAEIAGEFNALSRRVRTQQ